MSYNNLEYKGFTIHEGPMMTDKGISTGYFVFSNRVPNVKGCFYTLDEATIFIDKCIFDNKLNSILES